MFNRIVKTRHPRLKTSFKKKITEYFNYSIDKFFHKKGKKEKRKTTINKHFNYSIDIFTSKSITFNKF